MNDWNQIRDHYAEHEAAICAQRCEWAIDPYAWEDCGIRMTPIEAWLWADMRAAGAVMYPQYPVGRFFVDFANPAAKVAIECDGYAYHLDKGKDRRRDEELQAMGWTVYRFPGAVCATDQDIETGVLGEAARRLREIVETHRIGRQHQGAKRRSSV